MRSLIAASLLAIVVAGTQAFQQPTFKSGAKTVAVYATVTDKDGRLVPDLAQEDFEIRDSGKTQPIAVFSNEVQPISVVIMLDRSGSMRGNFGLVEAAGEAFVRAMLPADRARIGSFAEKVQIDPETFISDKKELINILRNKLQNEGPTPLWNAVDASISALKDQDSRKVVLAFTDGADNPGNFKLNNLSFIDIMRRAQVADVMVYAVGLESASRPPLGGGGGGLGGGGFGGGSRPDPGLPAIAEETGAGYFELRRAQDLAATFARVADELHRQYLIGFVPEKLDDKMHKIEVRVKKPGMKVRARKEYFAAK
ncbi:MAG: VWA domain-containing protein [Acidobacteria bacterium]|nr:VWA domain-containing protein [Acidobacteriota bacterium]